MSKNFYWTLEIILATVVFGPAVFVIGQKFLSIYEFATTPLNGFGGLAIVVLPAIAVAIALLSYPLYAIATGKAYAGALAAFISPIAIAISFQSYGVLSNTGSLSISEGAILGIVIMTVALALFVVGDRLRTSSTPQKSNTNAAN